MMSIPHLRVPLNSPILFNMAGIVNPCTKTEKATTAKLTVMTSSRRGQSPGNSSANASASAPRNPPQNSAFWRLPETFNIERENAAHKGNTAAARPNSTNAIATAAANQNARKRCVVARMPMNRNTNEFAANAAYSQNASTASFPRSVIVPSDPQFPMINPATIVAITPEK